MENRLGLRVNDFGFPTSFPAHTEQSHTVTAPKALQALQSEPTLMSVASIVAAAVGFVVEHSLNAIMFLISSAFSMVQLTVGLLFFTV